VKLLRPFRSRLMKDEMPLVDVYCVTDTLTAARKELRKELPQAYVNAQKGVTYSVTPMAADSTAPTSSRGGAPRECSHPSG
jgi:hypothetical protein